MKSYTTKQIVGIINAWEKGVAKSPHAAEQRSAMRAALKDIRARLKGVPVVHLRRPYSRELGCGRRNKGGLETTPRPMKVTCRKCLERMEQ